MTGVYSVVRDACAGDIELVCGGAVILHSGVEIYSGVEKSDIAARATMRSFISLGTAYLAEAVPE